jgi:hypothetical protein
MAGILANSASKTMVAGDTAVDKAVSAYLRSERITLSTNPAGTAYAWGQSIPVASSMARSALSATTGASVTFIPDVAGTYVVTCTVDLVTSYVIRIAVIDVVNTSQEQIRSMTPVADTQVPTPGTGVNLYYSSTQSKLAYKTTTGAIYTLNSTVV